MDIQRIKEIMLEQEPRPFDRYVLAPFLVFVGIKYKKLPKQVRRILVAAGIYQFYYGYKGYIKLQDDALTFLKSIQEKTNG